MQGWRARELCETVVLRSFPAFLHTLHTLHTFYEKVLYIYLYRVVVGGGLMRGTMSEAKVTRLTRLPALEFGKVCRCAGCAGCAGVSGVPPDVVFRA